MSQANKESVKMGFEAAQRVVSAYSNHELIGCENRCTPTSGMCEFCAELADAFRSFLDLKARHSDKWEAWMKSE